jgi:hypothetical protein
LTGREPLNCCTIVSIPPVLLPYGLSEQHREIRTTGKTRARPLAGHAQWQTPSLQQLSSTHIILPIFNNRNKSKSRSTRQYEPSKLEVTKLRRVVLGVATPRTKLSLTTAKARRDRTRRPKSKPVPQVYMVASSKKKSSKIVRGYHGGRGTKEAPINIDDDGDAAMADTGYRSHREVHSSHTRFRGPVNPLPSAISTIYSPQVNATTPLRSLTPYLDAHRAQREVQCSPPVAHRNQSIYSRFEK